MNPDMINDLISQRCFDWFGSNLKGCVSFDKNITVKMKSKQSIFISSPVRAARSLELEQIELLKRELKTMKD